MCVWIRRVSVVLWGLFKGARLQRLWVGIWSPLIGQHQIKIIICRMLRVIHGMILHSIFIEAKTQSVSHSVGDSRKRRVMRVRMDSSPFGEEDEEKGTWLLSGEETVRCVVMLRPMHSCSSGMT